MEEKLVSIDLILGWIQKQIENKNPIDPHTWLDACQKMMVLLSEEREKLFTYQQEVAQLRNLLLDDPDMSVAKAKSRIEATEEYKKARRQEAKINDILEMVRISKLQARMAKEEINNY